MFTDCRMRRTVGQRRRVSVASDTLHRAQRKKKKGLTGEVKAQ
ncbi:hypothetical protein HMPREF1613_03300 [Escherichia coli 908616]|nr:hypothetical protein HMPREF9552_02091 [Escherichia coli MS 198-1]ESD87118.1 hypothetical protein HMPREF1613_03300 [Escherichia coli 908616]